MRRIPSVRVLLPSVLVLLLLQACTGLNRRRVESSGESGMPQGFTGIYRVAYAEGHFRHRATLAVAFASPDRLRLEVLDALGTSRAVLVLSGDRALFLDPGNRAFRTFDTGREALEALAGLPLDPGLFPALLLDEIPRWPGVECRPSPDSLPPVELECLVEGGDPSVRVRESGREAQIHFRSGAVMTVRYEQPTGRPAGPPRTVRLEGSQPNVRLEFEVREMRFGRPGDEIFSTAPPKGFRPMPAAGGRIPLFAHPGP